MFHSTLTLAAFLVFSFATPAVRAAEPAPAPRAQYAKYDLTYFPDVRSPGLIGFRAAELTASAPRRDVRIATHFVLAACLQIFGQPDFDPDLWPTFDQIEQCVMCCEFFVTGPKKNVPASEPGGNGSFGGDFRTPWMLRTVRPFDWRKTFKATFPNAELCRHAGREYFSIPFTPSTPVPDEVKDNCKLFALFPDNRTVVVISNQDEVHAVIERVRDGKPGPRTPLGWDAVDRSVVAFAIDNQKSKFARGPFRDDDRFGNEMSNLSNSVQTIALGLSVGSKTKIRVLTTSADDTDARAATAALTGLFTHVVKKCTHDNQSEEIYTFGAKLFGSPAFSRVGNRVTATLTADGNAVELLFRSLLGGV